MRELRVINKPNAKWLSFQNLHDIRKCVGVTTYNVLRRHISPLVACFFMCATGIKVFLYVKHSVLCHVEQFYTHTFQCKSCLLFSWRHSHAHIEIRLPVRLHNRA